MAETRNDAESHEFKFFMDPMSERTSTGNHSGPVEIEDEGMAEAFRRTTKVTPPSAPSVKAWYQQKTAWTGIALIVTTAAGVLLEYPPEKIAALDTIIGGFALIFLRQGIEGSKNG